MKINSGAMQIFSLLSVQTLLVKKVLFFIAKKKESRKGESKNKERKR